LGFTQPYPSEETSGFLYDTKNSSDFDVINNTIIDIIKDFLSIRLLRRITGKTKVKRVLDYSTGNGRFAVSASKAFPKAIIDAVDYQDMPPSLLQLDCKKTGKENSNKKALNYFSLGDFRGKGGNYDLIILRHVLEHTHHPIALIKELSKLLAPEGILYIEVPNLNSGCASLFTTKWKGYYVPRHIFHYTKESLSEIICSAGMSADISFNEMPLMGNTISIFFGFSKSNVIVQAFGVLLHPIQVLIGLISGNPTCLNAKCKNII
jgi:2-polyprenyl-3-methyl-5-hydroxy-6-metoxy-1,4-benzoquinol methylase